MIEARCSKDVPPLLLPTGRDLKFFARFAGMAIAAALRGMLAARASRLG